MRSFFAFLFEKHNISLFLFFSISITIIAFVGTHPYQAPPSAIQSTNTIIHSINTFISSHYYISKNGKPSVYLNTTRLDLDQTSNEALLQNPMGHIYNEQNQITNYKAYKGYIKTDKNFLKLDDNVIIYNDESNLTADHVQYDKGSDLFKSQGNVKTYHISLQNRDKIYIDAQEADYKPSLKLSHYNGHVVGKIIRGLAYEPPIDFTSNSMQADMLAQIIELKGDVYLKRLAVEAWSLRGEILLENVNKKVKYYALYDDVRLTEKLKGKNNELIERKSFSEKLEGIISEQKIILTGYPKLIQGKDIIKGNKITFYEQNELVEVNDSNSSFELKETKKE